MNRGLANIQSPHRVTMSWQLSRMMFCTPSRILARELAETRLAAQLERHFSRRDIFTIYVNRVYFLDNVVGIQSASQYFFRKNPSGLNVSEAALLAGMIQSPARFSPVRHPDRALQRRNEIIDAMVGAHAISSTEAETARNAKLGVVSNDSAHIIQ